MVRYRRSHSLDATKLNIVGADKWYERAKKPLSRWDTIYPGKPQQNLCLPPLILI